MFYLIRTIILLANPTIPIADMIYEWGEPYHTTFYNQLKLID